MFLFCCVHVTSSACLSVLGEGSLHMGFLPSFYSPVNFIYLFFQYYMFFLTGIEGLRTEDVFHSTVSKAH